MPGAGAAGTKRSTWRASRSRCSAHSAAVAGSSPAIGELVVERGGGPMRRARIAVEAVERLGADGPPQSRQRRQRDSEGDGEQRDAADSRRARRRLPQPEPRHGEKQRDERRRPDQRRPQALEDDHRLGAARQSRQPARRRAPPRRAANLRPALDPSERLRARLDQPPSRKPASLAATTAEVCRGRSNPRSSAAAGRRRTASPLTSTSGISRREL